MKAPPSVDAFLESNDKWNAELRVLCKLVRSMGMDEAIKWGHPVYSVNGKNVVGLGSFKSYFGLWFFQGALMKDPDNVFVSGNEGKTIAQRQIRFHSIDELKPRKLKAYLKEAIELAKAGKEIKPDRNRPLNVPPELAAAFKKNKKADAAFKKLSLGKQREYVEYIETAKREETKQKRLEKILPMIIEGMGLNDKYRNC
ncbi:MAG: YdeI/OmpD-associated family protein [Pirellulaceae bacterium]